MNRPRHHYLLGLPTLSAGSLGLLVGLSLGIPNATATVIYKWTDDKGITHYTDYPPPNRQAERLELGVPTPSQGAEGGPQDPSEAGQREGQPPPTTAEINLSQAKIQVDKLQKAVEQARKKYEQAHQNRIEGEKIRYGNERNYVKYLERIEKLKEQERAAKEQLNDLKKQLEKAKQRLEKLRRKVEKQHNQESDTL